MFCLDGKSKVTLSEADKILQATERSEGRRFDVMTHHEVLVEELLIPVEQLHVRPLLCPHFRQPLQEDAALQLKSS